MAEPAHEQLPADEVPADAPQPPQESPKQEVSTPKGQFSPEGLSLGEIEKRRAEKGHEMLTGKKMEYDKDIEKNASQFKETVSAWWNKTKSMFSRSKNKGGEAEIGKINAKVEEARAKWEKTSGEAVAPEAAPDNLLDFKAAAEAAANAKYESLLASGDEAGLKTLEAELSKSFDELAPKVAAEGAQESKAMKKALKTGEMPKESETGAKLNDAARRLSEVRSRRGGASVEQIAAVRAPKPESKPETEPPAAEKTVPSAEAAPQAKVTPEAGKKTGKPGVSSIEGKTELLEKSKGLKGEKMIDAYLSARGKVGQTDQYGQISGVEFNARRGEIRTSYADGSTLRTYDNGVEQHFPKGMGEGGIQKARDRADLEKGSKGTKGEEMLDAYLAIRDSIGKTDAYGEISRVMFDPPNGEIRITYTDGRELRTFDDGDALLVLPDVKIKPERVKSYVFHKKTVEDEVLSAAEDQEKIQAGSEKSPSVEEEKPVEGVVSGETVSKGTQAEPEAEPSVIVTPEEVEPDMIIGEEPVAVEVAGTEKKEIDPKAALQKLVEGFRQKFEAPDGFIGALKAFEAMNPEDVTKDDVDIIEGYLKSQERAVAGFRAGRKPDLAGYVNGEKWIDESEADAIIKGGLLEEFAEAKARIHQQTVYLAKKILAKLAKAEAEKAPKAEEVEAEPAKAAEAPAPEAAKEVPSAEKPELATAEGRAQAIFDSKTFSAAGSAKAEELFLNDPKNAGSPGLAAENAAEMSDTDFIKLFVKARAIKRESVTELKKEFREDPDVFAAVRKIFADSIEVAASLPKANKPATTKKKKR